MKLLRWDLGTRALREEWKQIFSPIGLKQDVFAGSMVAAVALPLSLALALASGVPPVVGVVTAIVAGVVCAVFGGTPLAVSGPAAAMAVVIATSVEKFGMNGLLIIGMACGVMQLMVGVMGWGRLIRFVPAPVLVGFTSGIGVIILVSQLPRALGLEPPDQGHVFRVIEHLSDYFHDVKGPVLLISMLSLAIVKLLPRVAPRLPASLIAIGVAAILTSVFKFDIPLLGSVARSLPFHGFPSFPENGYGELIGTAFLVFALASLETLATSSVVDKLSDSGKKHDPDQEMIGQGLGNIAVTFFGGIPVTGVAIRSALNVRAGATGRRAAIIHSIVLLTFLAGAAPLIGYIPIAALAGMLIGVAFSMVRWREFLALWKASRSEASIFAITFLSIVFLDFFAGIQSGIIAALGIALLQLGSAKILYQRSGGSHPARLSFNGPITFLSSSRFEEMRESIASMPANQRLILDLSRVTYMDTSGAEMLLGLVETTLSDNHRLVLKGLNAEYRKVLESVDSKNLIKGLHAVSEDEVHKILSYGLPMDSGDRLAFGVERFRREERAHYVDLFQRLGEGQKPHTLFITCADSRIVPNLITSTDPGELFIVRNVGNIVPVFGIDQLPAEGAALEYGVDVLGVKEIIVCGHTACGAVATSFSDPKKLGLPSVQKWLAEVFQLRALHPEVKTGDALLPFHVKKQIDNLRTYPTVMKAINEGRLHLRAWIYDVKTSDIFQWHDESRTYRRVGVTKSDTGEFPIPVTTGERKNVR